MHTIDSVNLSRRPDIMYYVHQVHSTQSELNNAAKLRYLLVQSVCGASTTGLLPHLAVGELLQELGAEASLNGGLHLAR